MVFFGIVGYVFYWIIVIAPRRIKQLFKDLQKKGYKIIPTDNSDLKDVLPLLAPAYPKRPRKDQEVPAWTIRNAAKSYDSQATRFIIHTSRLQVDRPGAGENATERRTIIFIENRKLDIQGTIHLTPKENPGNNFWKDRYNLKLITDSCNDKFMTHYDGYSADHTSLPFPDPLSKTLIEICPTFNRKELFCFQGGINLMFCADGWGFCPANEVYKEADFNVLLDVFDKISNSLY